MNRRIRLQPIKRAFCIAAILGGGLLLVGQYITDQFSSVQMLHWAPPALIPFFGLLSIVLGDTKSLRTISGIFCLITVMHWCIHDWKPKKTKDRPTQSITFMHWTVEEIDESRAQTTLQVARNFETDFLCMVNINTVLRLPWKEQLSHLPYQKVQWPFLFASRWPMTCEIVLRENHTVKHPLNIARGSIDHPDGIITFVALDCPSDPNLSRMGTSHRIREALGASAEDWVFGDFNCPRNAASIQQAFPHHTHAFDRAGNGPVATWPARFPMLHLDHLLLNNKWTCLQYGTRRPGVGDHLPQRAQLIRATHEFELKSSEISGRRR